MGKLNYKLVNLSMILIIFFLIFKIIPLSFDVFSLLKGLFVKIVLSFFFAFILYKIERFFEKYFSSFFSIIITFIILFFVSFLFIFVFVPSIIDEVINLKDLLFDSYLGNFLSDKLFSIITPVISYGTSILFKSISVIKDLIIILILTFTIFFNIEKIFNLTSNILKRYKNYTLYLNIFSSFDNYFSIVMRLVLIEMVEYTLMFLIIGHPDFLIVGFLMGVTSIIPYIGNTFINVIAVVMAFNVSKHLFIATLIVVLVVPILDSYVRDPKIFKSGLKLSPFKVILSLIFSSMIFGSIGFILAVPFLIVIDEIFKYYGFN